MSGVTYDQLYKMQSIIEIEKFASVLSRPVEAAEKAIVFTENILQNKFDDSSLVFT